MAEPSPADRPVRERVLDATASITVTDGWGAVTMAKVAGNSRVDWALGHAAVNGRGHTDLASILNAHPPVTTRRARESRSLAQGASSLARISPMAHPGAAEVSAVTE